MLENVLYDISSIIFQVHVIQCNISKIARVFAFNGNCRSCYDAVRKENWRCAATIIPATFCDIRLAPRLSSALWTRAYTDAVPPRPIVPPQPACDGCFR